ncbi:MAG: class I SAM-dependent methyltransferase [Nitrospina sp.]|nr:class I SAM-dependent methyltransferase [Nitrospina sp.]
MKNNIPLPPYFSFVKQNRTIEQALSIFNQRLQDAETVFKKFSHEFENRNCPICGAGDYSSLEPFHKTYGVVKCHQCTSVYVNPCPSYDALNYYYNECKCNDVYARLLRSRGKTGSIVLSDRATFLIELIRKELGKKKHIRILEIGCSSGAFLSELKTGLEEQELLKNCSLSGIDIDSSAIEKNVDQGLNLYGMSVENFSKNTKEKFDLIIHFELVEHLRDPFNFMLSVHKLLLDDGLHHFCTPNMLGFENIAIGYNEFRPLAHGIFPPMHLHSFTTQNIIHFSIRSGFKVAQIDTPGNFDVDIVANAVDGNPDNQFSFISEFTEKQLGIVQHWLKLLSASSHMRCTLLK